MSDNVRYHSKWHGKNHHTSSTAGYFDSARDPIAGPGQEFQGDFYLSGAFVAITNPSLSAQLGAQEINDILGTRTTIQANSANWNQGSKWAANGSDIYLSNPYTQVGIGTSSPNAKLQVVGNTNTDVALIGTAGTRLTIQPDDAVGEVKFKVEDPSGNNYAKFMTFHTEGGFGTTERMRITFNGNVGIGTSSPYGQLTLSSSDSSSIYIADGASSSTSNRYIAIFHDNGLRIQTRTDANVFVSNDYIIENNASGATVHRWNIANSEKMRITSSGNVGIGTSSPAKTLDINTASATFRIRDASAGNDFAFKTTAGPVSVVGCEANASLALMTNDTERMRITFDGNVGIGTTAPTRTLHLSAVSSTTPVLCAEGEIHASGDIVAFSTSDERLKDGVTNITDPIEKVKLLNGITFEWNSLATGKSGVDYGVLAQDVEKVLPRAVVDRDTGYKAVKYDKIIPLLIEAIKDQQEQIDELKAKL